MRRINPYCRFNFSPIDDWLMPRREVSDAAKLCYGRLRRYAGRNGHARPSTAELADEMGKDPRSAQRYLRELAEQELIEPGVDDEGRDGWFFLWHPWMGPAAEASGACASARRERRPRLPRPSQRRRAKRHVCRQRDDRTVASLSKDEEGQGVEKKVAAGGDAAADPKATEAKPTPEQERVARELSEIGFDRHRIPRIATHHPPDLVRAAIVKANALCADPEKRGGYVSRCLSDPETFTPLSVRPPGQPPPRLSVREVVIYGEV